MIWLALACRDRLLLPDDRPDTVCNETRRVQDVGTPIPDECAATHGDVPASEIEAMIAPGSWDATLVWIDRPDAVGVTFWIEDTTTTLTWYTSCGFESLDLDDTDPRRQDHCEADWALRFRLETSDGRLRMDELLTFDDDGAVAPEGAELRVPVRAEDWADPGDPLRRGESGEFVTHGASVQPQSLNPTGWAGGAFCFARDREAPVPGYPDWDIADCL